MNIAFHNSAVPRLNTLHQAEAKAILYARGGAEEAEEREADPHATAKVLTRTEMVTRVRGIQRLSARRHRGNPFCAGRLLRILVTGAAVSCRL